MHLLKFNPSSETVGGLCDRELSMFCTQTDRLTYGWTNRQADSSILMQGLKNYSPVSTLALSKSSSILFNMVALQFRNNKLSK